MNFGKKIKELRNEKNLTQDELAFKLQVSVQTISRWENDVNYPDITMLPIIASIFETSIDSLLGYDKVLADTEWVKIYNQINEFNKFGKASECIAFLKDVLKEYPNEVKILLWYANECRLIPNNKDLINEAIDIYNRIIRTSLDEGNRSTAISGLFYCYMILEDKVMMKEIYDNYIKNNIKVDYYKMYFLEGNEKIEYLQLRIQRDVKDIWNSIRQLRLTDYYSKEEKIIILQKYNDIMKIIYEEEDYGLSYWNLYSINKEIFERYNKLGNYEKCIEYIQKATDLAIKYDNLPKNIKLTSLLSNMIKETTDNVTTMFGANDVHGNWSFELLNTLENEEFSIYINDIRLINIKNMLKDVARKF